MLNQLSNMVQTNLINIKALAKEVGMSRSAFFTHFKDATELPKRFRLLEARRLLSEESHTAELAGWSVGYKSASHFSRDYVKMVGKPPVKDTEK
jgi:AraC-like DNA-binding protein